MNITETNKTRIQALMKIASEQVAGIDSLSIQINDGFDIEPFVPYLINDQWPLAVDPLLIADPNSEEDKTSRAHGILSIVVTDPVTGKFLDFGCGEGHVVAQVATTASLSVGYDPVQQGSWSNFKPASNMVFTTTWDDVVKRGPYDAILIYDVLDHLKDEAEAVDSLKKVKSVLTDNGKVYVRCHPWCSRHGTHLYLSVNKAYLHLCLSEKSLDALGYKYLHTIKVIHPLQTYGKWLQSAGFDTPLSLNIIPEGVEAFFKQPALAALVKSNWKDSPEENFSSGKDYPEWQMRQQFVDYVLENKKHIVV